jgi:hypothetical protein
MAFAAPTISDAKKTLSTPTAFTSVSSASWLVPMRLHSAMNAATAGSLAASSAAARSK